MILGITKIDNFKNFNFLDCDGGVHKRCLNLDSE